MTYPTTRKVNISIPKFSAGASSENDQHTQSLSIAREIINFSISGGALRPGMGLSPYGDTALKNRLSQLKNVRFITQFRRTKPDGTRADFLICLNGTDLVAVDMQGAQENKTIYTNMTDIPVAVNYNLNSEDVIIFCSKSSPMVVWNGEQDAYEVLDAPPITSMVMHYERLFATASGGEKNCVWFSDDLDPTNWTLSLLEAGFIQMVDERGAALKVLSFLDYVYVFREYGIARISGYGDQTQFLVSQLSTSTGRIFEGTVTLCGDIVLFLAEDGVYSFNGLSTNKILPQLNGYFEGVDNLNATAVAGDGKWYLSCKMKLEDKDEKLVETKVLLEYDLNKKTFTIGTGLNVVALTALKTEQGSGILVVSEQEEPKTEEDGEAVVTSSVYALDHSGAILGKPLKGVWKSDWSDLNMPHQRKLVRRISLRTKGWATLTIETDKYKQEVLYWGIRQPDPYMAAVSGRRIRFIIEADAKDVEISGLNAEVLLR